MVDLPKGGGDIWPSLPKQLFQFPTQKLGNFKLRRLRNDLQKGRVYPNTTVGNKTTLLNTSVGE